MICLEQKNFFKPDTFKDELQQVSRGNVVGLKNKNTPTRAALLH